MSEPTETPGNGTPPPPANPPAGDWIPKARLDEVSRDLRQLRARITELEAERTIAQRDLSTRGEELGALRGELAKRDRVGVLFRAGVRDEQGNVPEDMLDYLAHRYEGHAPAEGQERPEFGAWLEEFRATDPVVLRPFKPAAPAPPGQPGAPRPGAFTLPQPQPPRESPRPQGPPTAGVGFTADQIARMTVPEYKAAKEALREQMKRGEWPR